MEILSLLDEHQGWFLVTTFVFGLIVGFVSAIMIERHIQQKDKELFGGKHDD